MYLNDVKKYGVIFAVVINVQEIKFMLILKNVYLQSSNVNKLEECTLIDTV